MSLPFLFLRLPELLRCRSLRAELGLAFSALVAVAVLNLAVSFVAARQGEQAFADVQQGIRAAGALVEAKHRLDDHWRQINVVSAVGASPSQAEALRIRAALDSIPALLVGIEEARAVTSEEFARLRAGTVALVDSWSRFYLTQEQDPELAVAELVLRARPLAEDLISVRYPRAIRSAERATARAVRQFREDQRARFRSLAALLFFSILAGAALTFFTLRRVLDAVGRLKEGAARIGAGELEYRLSLSGKNELAEVAERFNWMAERLGEANAELRMRYADLAETLDRLQGEQPERVQGQKMSALGGMLAGLAHELNNPLAGILGYAELLDERLRQSAQLEHRGIQRELVEPLVSEALRARDLVRSLLQFSRKSEMTLQAVPIEQALQTTIRLRSYAFAQAGLALKIDVAPGLAVRAEVQRLQQVFLNLINNAYDALRSGKGTRLLIRAEQLEAGWVTVTFTDDGPGLVAPERVFDPFYTTKAVGEGTGLGLTLVHRFVRDFGGWITAANAPQGGAIFVLRLRAEPAAGQAASSTPTGQAGVGGAAPGRNTDRDHEVFARGRRALVVEDEEPLRQLQRRILARAGFDVMLASAGAEARELIQREKIDLIISDIKMPGELDGIALFKWLHADRPELAERFLFVTGDVDEVMRNDLFGAQPHRFLTKPFRLDEYLERVRKTLSAAAAWRPRGTAAAMASGARGISGTAACADRPAACACRR